MPYGQSKIYRTIIEEKDITVLDKHRKFEEENCEEEKEDNSA